MTGHTFSMPTTVTSLFLATALATSMPMKELPMITIFFFPSPMAVLIAFVCEISLRTKMLPSSLKPGSGSFLGVPPVARTSLVYGNELPLFVETFGKIN